MPLVPKQGEIRTKNIIDGAEFDTIYSSGLYVLNSGMDRENLPEASCESATFEDYAFHQYWQGYAKLPESRVSEYNDVIPATTYDGLIYDDYVGGYEINTTYPLSCQLVEGELHVEFNSWYWFNPTAIIGGVNGDWVGFQILLNNNVISETHNLYQRFGTIHLVATVPVATGVGEITVSYRLPSRNSNSVLQQQVFYMAGGNLLAINRFR